MEPTTEGELEKPSYLEEMVAQVLDTSIRNSRRNEINWEKKMGLIL